MERIMKSGMKLAVAVLAGVPLAGCFGHPQQAEPQQAQQVQAQAQQAQPQAQQAQAQAQQAQPQAQQAQPQAQQAQPLSCIGDITYSREFLAKYPDAPAACQEAFEANGQKWVRFNAKVESAKDGQATVDLLNTHGNPLGVLTFAFTPDAQVVVNGRPVMASSLKGGEEVVMWMPEKQFGFYAEPGEPESQKFRLVSTDTSEKR
jgi:hypothetical protein